ncbi:MAG: hypothetical protein KY469_21865 [Actinobacteria bacterium]|nr:hypothetical protein [Actinomycetota bacterium]
MGGETGAGTTVVARPVRRVITWHLLPFAVIAVAAIPLSFLPPDEPNATQLAIAGVITVAAFLAAAVLPWDRLPPPRGGATATRLPAGGRGPAAR